MLVFTDSSCRALYRSPTNRSLVLHLSPHAGVGRSELYALYTIVLRDPYDFLDVIAQNPQGQCDGTHQRFYSTDFQLVVPRDAYNFKSAGDRLDDLENSFV